MLWGTWQGNKKMPSTASTSMSGAIVIFQETRNIVCGCPSPCNLQSSAHPMQLVFQWPFYGNSTSLCSYIKKKPNVWSRSHYHISGKCLQTIFSLGEACICHKWQEALGQNLVNDSLSEWSVFGSITIGICPIQDNNIIILNPPP